MKPNIWHLQLHGHPSDLAHLADNLSLPQVAVKVDCRDGGCTLYSDAFEDAQDSATVLARAIPILAILNGLLRIIRNVSDPVSTGAVFRTNASGGRDVFLHPAPAVVRIETWPVSVTIADKDGNAVPAPPPPPSRTHLLARLAVTNPIVAKAMRLLAAPDSRTWVGIYRLYEVIEGDLGSRSSLIDKGWASKSDIRRFKHSASSVAVAGDAARHGRDTGAPPRHPMTLHEGSAFIDYLTQAWLTSKGA